jgi:hypothetical protein
LLILAAIAATNIRLSLDRNLGQMPMTGLMRLGSALRCVLGSALLQAGF